MLGQKRLGNIYFSDSGFFRTGVLYIQGRFLSCVNKEVNYKKKLLKTAELAEDKV